MAEGGLPYFQALFNKILLTEFFKFVKSFLFFVILI